VFKNYKYYIIVFIIAALFGFCLSEFRGQSRLDELENHLTTAAEIDTRLRATINQSEIRVEELKRQYQSDLTRVRKQIVIIESIGIGLDSSERTIRQLTDTNRQGLELIEKIQKRNTIK